MRKKARACLNPSSPSSMSVREAKEAKDETYLSHSGMAHKIG